MYTSQPSDRMMPMITPASTPAVSTPRMASMAIQKSNRLTRHNRRIWATSIIPKTTASMMIAPRTGLGRSENSGAKISRVSTTTTPVTIDAICVRAPDESASELADRLVDTGIPWNTPLPMFDTPSAIDSLSTRIR